MYIFATYVRFGYLQILSRKLLFLHVPSYNNRHKLIPPSERRPRHHTFIRAPPDERVEREREGRGSGSVSKYRQEQI